MITWPVWNPAYLVSRKAKRHMASLRRRRRRLNAFDGRPLAQLVVKAYGHGVYRFTWCGPEDATLLVSHELEGPRFSRPLRLSPWLLEKIGDDELHNVALYRRVMPRPGPLVLIARAISHLFLQPAVPL